MCFVYCSVCFGLDWGGDLLNAQSPMFRVNPEHTGAVQGRGPRDYGRVLWKFETGGMVQSSSAIVDGQIYIGSNDGFLYALSACTGRLRWKHQTGGK